MSGHLLFTSRSVAASGWRCAAYKHYPANHALPSSSGFDEPRFRRGFNFATASIHSNCLFNHYLRDSADHVSEDASKYEGDGGKTAANRRFKKRGAGERRFARGVAVGSAKGMLSSCKS